MTDHADASEFHHPEPPPHRRSFLKWVTHGLGAMFTVVLGAPVIAYLIDPRNKKAKKGEFQEVAKLSDLKVGVPQQVSIRDVRTDAWTLHPNDVIGRVWLIRREDDKVDAYSTICPHLGCSINFIPENHCFLCPCHNGCFTMEGEMRTAPSGANNPAARGMDSLDVQIEKDPENPKDKLIKVKYQKFEQLKEEKIVKT